MPTGVSVLLPVYNGANYLPWAIESVLGQKYADFELLISDDCSDDGSREIIQLYASKEPRIKFWQNPTRRGLFGNYNECLARATGRFIKPFAQDDVLQPDAIARSVQTLEAFPQVALVSVARRFVDWSGAECADFAGTITAGKVCGADKVVSSRDVIRESLFPLRNIIGEPSCVTFRREHIGDGFDEAFHHTGDLEYWFRILSRGEFFYLSDKLVDFRWHSQSTSYFNISGLQFLPDVWRFGIKHESLVEKLGRTRSEYEQVALTDLARNIQFLIARGDLDPDQLTLNPASEDIDYIRVIALNALRGLARTEFGEENFRQSEEQERITKVIQSREKKLQTLLSSKSWHATKVFRDINRFMGVASQEPSLDGALELPGQRGQGLEQQREYIKSLRRLHRRVTRSRSWTVTQPFRSLAKQAENRRTKCGAGETRAQSGYENYLAIAAIFRNEARYLKEWLEFHRLVGVERFYLFNNLSTDEYASVLEPYIREGIVELIDWPVESTTVDQWNNVQCTAYTMAARLAEGKARWLAFIDVDEFLFPLADSDLRDLLVNYEAYGGVCANWRLFGTSGVCALGQNSLVIENLTSAAAADHREHRYIKSIVQPERVTQCIDPHFWQYKRPFTQVTTDGTSFSGSRSPAVRNEKIRINHYRLRDQAGYEASKRQRYAAWGFADGLAPRYFEELNEVRDEAILRFLPQLKARMLV